MQLQEHFDLPTLHFLNHLSFETFKKELTSYHSAKGTKVPAIEKMKESYKSLQQFCTSLIRSRGVFLRSYAYSLNTPEETVGGRLYASGSLQFVPKLFSNLLYRNSGCTDIDMVNAHPVILRYICRKHGIPCPNLENYIINRDVILASFSSREKGKKAFLCSTNMDNPLKGKKNHSVLVSYDMEMKEIQKKIVELPDYKDITSRVPVDKVNWYGSAVNNILCFYENKILQAALHVARLRNVEPLTLMYDGFVVAGNHYETPELLQAITDYVNEQFPNLEMRWQFKPWDTSFRMPEDFSVEETVTEFRHSEDHHHAMSMIYEELQDQLIHAQKTFYLKRGHLWISDLETIDACLLKYITSSNIKKRNDKGEYASFAQNVGHAEKILKLLYANVIQHNLYSEEIYSKFHTTTRGRLAFLDGVLDFSSRSFHPWDALPFEFYTTVIIKRNFLEFFLHPKLEIVREIEQKVFDNLFGDKKQLALRFLSRAIAGCIQDKNFASYVGNRNCGKGVIYGLLKNAFGDYVHSLTLSHLLYERMTTNDEAERMLAWLIDLEFKRIAISQETPPVTSNLKVNSAMLKKICSGGDEQTARYNYDKRFKTFLCDVTLMMMGNNSLRFDSADVHEHHIDFFSTVQFKTQKNIDDLRAEGTSELLLQNYKVADDKIKDLCSHETDYANACVWLLLDNYRPDRVVARPVVDAEEQDIRLNECIVQTYDITGKEEDRLLCIEVYEKIGGDYRKIAVQLESFNVKKRKCTTRGEQRNKQCFYGIRERQDDKE